MFPDLGSKKTHWIHCMRKDGEAGKKRQEIDQRSCRSGPCSKQRALCFTV